MSKIEWTEKTWNPTTGCSKVSQGCKNCYAEVMHKRLQVMQPKKYGRPFLAGAVEHKDSLLVPMSIKKPTVWFVNSMSDLFHKDISFDFIDQVFAVMAVCKQHTFQILTKRPERMSEYFKYKNLGWKNEGMQGDERIRYQTYHLLGMEISRDEWSWPLKNVWLGTSCENQATADERIPYLLDTPAAVRFLSCEPLLGRIVIAETSINKIDWVIAGGESGHGARPMHPDWVRSLRNQCNLPNVSFFFKQWGQWAPGSYLNSILDRTRAAVLSNGDYGASYPGSPFHKKYTNDAWGKLNPTAMSSVGKKEAGRMLEGRTWDEMPEVKMQTTYFKNK